MTSGSPAGFLFCPTGGIDLEKAPEYLRLPNVTCVGGSWMLQKAASRRGTISRSRLWRAMPAAETGGRLKTLSN